MGVYPARHACDRAVHSVASILLRINLFAFESSTGHVEPLSAATALLLALMGGRGRRARMRWGSIEEGICRCCAVAAAAAVTAAEPAGPRRHMGDTATAPSAPRAATWAERDRRRHYRPVAAPARPASCCSPLPPSAGAGASERASEREFVRQSVRMEENRERRQERRREEWVGLVGGQPPVNRERRRGAALR